MVWLPDRHTLDSANYWKGGSTSGWLASAEQPRFAWLPDLAQPRTLLHFAVSIAWRTLPSLVDGKCTASQSQLAFQGQWSFWLLKIGSHMWWSTSTAKVLAFWLRPVEKLTRFNFKQWVYMQCRLNLRPPLQLPRNSLRSKERQHQFPCRPISLSCPSPVLWAKLSMISWSRSLHRISGRASRLVKLLKLSESAWRLRRHELCSSSQNVFTQVQRDWAMVLCAKRSHELHALHGNTFTSTCWLGSFDTDGLTKAGRWTTLLSYEHDILCLQETHVSASKQQVLTSSTSLHCLWGAPISGNSRCGVGIVALRALRR